jgi:hypothetical protein
MAGSFLQATNTPPSTTVRTMPISKILFSILIKDLSGCISSSCARQCKRWPVTELRSQYYFRSQCTHSHLSFTDISQAFAAANRIRRMRPQKNGDNRSSRIDLRSLEACEKEPRGMKIELKNVVFKYPTRDVPVLNGLNMTVSYTYGMKHRD